MRKALVAMGRWFGAPSVTLVGDGGSAAQGSPVLACPGSYGAPWLRELAQKQEGVGRSSPGGRGGRGCSAGGRRRTPAAAMAW